MSIRTTRDLFQEPGEQAGDWSGLRGPRGCPGPAGPQGPQPPLSDAVDSPVRDTAASSLALRTVYTSRRIPRTSDVTLYVTVDGDDRHDGLGMATAKRTLSGALAELQRYEMRGTFTTIRFGPGEFPAGVFKIQRPTLAGHTVLTLRGAGQDSTLPFQESEEYLFRIYGVHVRFAHLPLRGELYYSEHAFGQISSVTLEPADPGRFLMHAQRMALIWTDTMVV